MYSSSLRVSKSLQVLRRFTNSAKLGSLSWRAHSGITEPMKSGFSMRNRVFRYFGFGFGWGNKIPSPTKEQLLGYADKHTYQQFRQEFASKVATMDPFFSDGKSVESAGLLSFDACLAIVWQCGVLASQKSNAIAIATADYRLQFIDKQMKKYEEAFMLCQECYEDLIDQSNKSICKHYGVDEELFSKSFQDHFTNDKRFASLVDLFVQNSHKEKPDEPISIQSDEEYAAVLKNLISYLRTLEHKADQAIDQAFRVAYANDRYFLEFGKHPGLIVFDKTKMSKQTKSLYSEFQKLVQRVG